LTAEGWALWHGVQANQRLHVSLACGLGRIVAASAFRLPRPDLVAAGHHASLFAAGYGLRLAIETFQTLPRLPADPVSIAPIGVAVDRPVPSSAANPLVR
jgi:hypothetical protein